MRLIQLLALIFLPIAPSMALTEDSHPITASLIAETQSIQPGTPFWVALHLEMEPGWHTFYEEPGDTGLPTTLEWTLPEGFSASPIQWPIPITFDSVGFASKGYKDEATHLVLISPPDTLENIENVTLTAQATWLACNDECIPGEANLSLTLPISPATPLWNQPWHDHFEQERQNTMAGKQPTVQSHLFEALAFAFIGGLILNLMPCVFPILGLKIMSFTQQAGNNPAKIKLHGLSFTLGVLLSFLALSATLLALRAAGEYAGWGFQLQNPLFIAFLTALLFLIGLNFAGVFEIGTSLIGLGNKLTPAASGYSGSFASGILATLLATPCTAPFMGTALAYALNQPAPAALLIFQALGLGMATPYLALACSPKLIEKLPKPGHWMNTLKELMAFPMLGTAIWLLWVFGSQTNNSATAQLLFALLFLALAAYLYGKFHSTLAKATTLLFLALALYTGYSASQTEFTPSSSSAQADWIPFSPETLNSLTTQNKPVFIDFTATWCLTCQANKKNALSKPKVIQAFKDKNVTLMIADWTRRDPVITQALQSYNQSGVPTNILYTGTPNSEPVVLPKLLTPSIVLDALDQIAPAAN